MRREWPLERDEETLQYGFCIRHHGLDDILRRPNVLDQADALPGEPGHLLPIAVGVGGRREHVEFAHFRLLPEEYRPPDHREIVADSWDLGETVGPLPTTRLRRTRIGLKSGRSGPKIEIDTAERRKAPADPLRQVRLLNRSPMSPSPRPAIT